MSYKSYLFLLLLSLSIGACKKNRVDNTSTPTPVEVVPTLPIKTQYTATPADSALPDFKEMSAKLKVTANMNGKSQSFTTQIRWHKNKKIWMSMSIIGIEGVRMLITKDSIQYIDRLNNEFLNKPYSHLSKLIKMDIPFEALERLLLGLPTFMDKNNVVISESEQLQQWNSLYGKNIQTTSFFSKINNMLIEYKAEDGVLKRNLLSRYGDFRNLGNKQFSFDRFMRFVQNGEIVEVQAKFTDVVLTENLSYPFEIPSKYKRID